MNIHCISAAIIIALTSVSTSLFAQNAEESTVLSPEDLGIKKYIFQAMAPADSVVVFRQDQYSNDRLVDRYETVSNTPKEKHTERVMFIDWRFLRGETAYSLGVSGSFGELKSVRWKSSEFSSPILKICFEDSSDNGDSIRSYIFTIGIQTYADAIARVPNLPKNLADAWTFSQFYNFSNQK